MKSKIYLLSTCVVVLLLLAAPYYLFEGKSFIGGDDTRLLYLYPAKYLLNWGLYSWNSVSSLNFYNSSFHLIPFLLFWSGISVIINNSVSLGYLAFSTPLILGFIFMTLTLEELTGLSRRYEFFIGSLIYILSPIFFLHQFQIFLTPVWLIGAFPLFLFLILRFVRSGSLRYLFILSALSILFSFVFYAFAWIFGLLIPFVVGVAILKILKINIISLKDLRRIMIGFMAISITQLFWFIPFVVSLLPSDSSFGARVFSSTAVDTFSPTILATAKGNIFYPLLNLFHPQIIFDFDWTSQGIFSNYYMNFIPVFAILPFIIFYGIYLSLKKKTQVHRQLIQSFLLFLVALYFFTINIGFLKYAFLVLGNIPGFVMFRNYYDKFEIGYVFFYAIAFSFSFLAITLQKPRLSKVLAIAVSIVVLIMIIPYKQLVNSEVWRSEGYYKTVTLPQEYFEFINQVESTVPVGQQILSLPFNNAGYVVLMDDNGKNAYVGTSPLKILANRNDITGDLSLPGRKAGEFNILIKNRDYSGIKQFLYDHHINYVLTINNIPQELGMDYFKEEKKDAIQDKDFVKSIVRDKLYESSGGNFSLYSLASSSALFSDNVTYERINPTRYELDVSFNNGKEFYFKEAFHPEWSLSPLEQTNAKVKINHMPYKEYGNKWVVSTDEKTHKFILQFKPQIYLNYGIFSSIVIYTIFLTVLILWRKKL